MSTNAFSNGPKDESKIPHINLAQSSEPSGVDHLNQLQQACSPNDYNNIAPRRTSHTTLKPSINELSSRKSPQNQNNYTSLGNNASLTPIQSNSSVDSVLDLIPSTLIPPPSNFDPTENVGAGADTGNPQSPQNTMKASLSAPPTPSPLNLRQKGERTNTISRRASESSLGNNLNNFTKNYIIPAAKWAYYPIVSSTSGKRQHEKGSYSKRKGMEIPEYIIEYSVFRPIRGLPRICNEHDFLKHWALTLGQEYDGPINNHSRTKFVPSRYPDNYITPDDVNRLIDSIVESIEVDNLAPERISQGSSGSYFIFDKKVVDFGATKAYRAGIFKPKDEEPYGPLSPKWTKWLHRTFFPCFFGRSCLIPNLGYISETAASVLDEQLLSYIVPHTDIIYLKSSAFYHSYWDRHSRSLPAKIGSFQLFLNGYMEAQSWFKLNPLPHDTSQLPDTHEIIVDMNEENFDNLQFAWSKHSLQQFQEQLEQLVILDYIMRNTDRGLDNWMIKVEWRKKTVKSKKKKKAHAIVTPYIKIGAIDSGLAFPWKHPDEWRSFPFGWLFLPLSIIGQPFSRKTRNHYLPLLTSKYWWETTVVKLKNVFKKDADFKERMWLKQLAVLKGQAFNVVEILKLGYAGPLELTRRENLLIWDDEMNVPIEVDSSIMTNAMESSIYDLSPPKRSESSNDRQDGSHWCNGIDTIIESEDEEDKKEPYEQHHEERENNNDTEYKENVLLRAANIPMKSGESTNEFVDKTGQASKHDLSQSLHSACSEYSKGSPLNMSGFEYNMTYTNGNGNLRKSTTSLAGDDEQTHLLGSGDSSVGYFMGGGTRIHPYDDGTNTKKVVIERLEKVNSKPPVFTWC